MDEILHNKSLCHNYNKVEIYDQWADTYENYVESIGYNGPKNFSKVFKNLAKEGNIRVLDFGCGTGLLGNEIKNLFSNEVELIGVDISDNMISKAEEKGCYNKIFNANLDELCVEEIIEKFGYFDYIVSCGVFVEGHVGFHIFNKLLQICKEAIFFTVRESLMNEDIKNFDRYVRNRGTYVEQDIEYLDNVKCKLIII